MKRILFTLCVLFSSIATGDTFFRFNHSAMKDTAHLSISVNNKYNVDVSECIIPGYLITMAFICIDASQMHFVHSLLLIFRNYYHTFSIKYGFKEEYSSSGQILMDTYKALPSKTEQVKYIEYPCSKAHPFVATRCIFQQTYDDYNQYGKKEFIRVKCSYLAPPYNRNSCSIVRDSEKVMFLADHYNFLWYMLEVR
ncbi:MAG: hypothetical protein QS748_07195 [Candidatus Endonucleobacter bathymodioli]|uniref:Uncharacterized protein n=1 Tax=Candidatus Endonucleibacter bathymodioli TaxID=539814 RepID=A0AA90SSZ4_9GAMM|nr:hypothetical protein [Candidatus Endonucleobacter bathymodioli]